MISLENLQKEDHIFKRLFGMFIDFGSQIDIIRIYYQLLTGAKTYVMTYIYGINTQTEIPIVPIIYMI